jgi:hypothetical protein
MADIISLAEQRAIRARGAPADVTGNLSAGVLHDMALQLLGRSHESGPRERRLTERDDYANLDPGQAETLRIMDRIIHKMGLMPHEAWVAAGRPEGK